MYTQQTNRPHPNAQETVAAVVITARREGGGKEPPPPPPPPPPPMLNAPIPMPIPMPPALSCVCGKMGRKEKAGVISLTCSAITHTCIENRTYPPLAPPPEEEEEEEAAPVAEDDTRCRASAQRVSAWFCVCVRCVVFWGSGRGEDTCAWFCGLCEVCILLG